MIMISIILGSTLYSTTLLIASSLLPQMQGAMAATQDEIAWVMTFNILATAVMTPGVPVTITDSGVSPRRPRPGSSPCGSAEMVRARVTGPAATGAMISADKTIPQLKKSVMP